MNRSLTSGKKKRKRNERSLVFEDSNISAIENYFWNLDCSSGEEGRRRSKQTRNLATYASGRTHARNGGRAVSATALSVPSRLRSSSPRARFFHVRKAAIICARDILLCEFVLCSSDPATVREFPETVRIISHFCIILSHALHK